MALLLLVAAWPGRMAHAAVVVCPYEDVSSALTCWGSFYGIAPSYLWSIVRCESGGAPTAYNPSGASGAWQFMPATFWAAEAAMNADESDHSGYEYGSYWDVEASTHVAAYMIGRLGLASQWTCASMVYG